MNTVQPLSEPIGPRTYSPSEEACRKAPSLVCAVASRVLRLREAIRLGKPHRIEEFIAPLPFEADLLSGNIERVDSALANGASNESNVQASCGHWLTMEEGIGAAVHLKDYDRESKRCVSFETLCDACLAHRKSVGDVLETEADQEAWFAQVLSGRVPAAVKAR